MRMYNASNCRAVASNWQTEALASVIFFVFVVQSHQNTLNSHEENETMDIASVTTHI